MSRWRAVEGYEGLYEASEDGRVRRVAGSRTAPKARELKPYRHRTGYHMVRLYTGGRGTGKGQYVHRLVAQAFLGPIPEGHQVNHRDGDKANNAVANLEYVTAAENIAHAEANGLRPKATGDAHGGRKLDSVTVKAIRQAAKAGGTQRQLAHRYGVSESQVSRIVNRKHWRGV